MAGALKMDLPLETGVFPVPFNVMTITGAAGSGRSVVTRVGRDS